MLWTFRQLVLWTELPASRLQIQTLRTATPLISRISQPIEPPQKFRDRNHFSASLKNCACSTKKDAHSPSTLQVPTNATVAVAMILTNTAVAEQVPPFYPMLRNGAFPALLLLRSGPRLSHPTSFRESLYPIPADVRNFFRRTRFGIFFAGFFADSLLLLMNTATVLAVTKDREDAVEVNSNKHPGYYRSGPTRAKTTIQSRPIPDHSETK